MESRTKGLVERFWSKVEIIPFHSCWEWTAGKDWDGYGHIKHEGKTLKAHRLSLMLHGIKLDKTLVVDHICKNPSCVNPSHLRQVTTRFNVIENSCSPSAINAYLTHCARGHKLKDSTRNSRNKKVQRYCTECKKIYAKNKRKLN